MYSERDIHMSVNLLLGGGTQIGLGVAFLGAASCVVFAGIKLSKYGDALGERTGMGSGLVGLLVLAGVTSLPELVVSTTSALTASLEAVRTTDAAAQLALLTGGADLALGNMLGSNVFNLMLIPLMDSIYREGPIAPRLSQKHILSAAGGTGMLGVLLFGAVLGGSSNGTIPVLCAGFITPLLLLAYLGLMSLQSRLESRDQGTAEPGTGGELVSMGAFRFYATLVALAGVIVLSGIWLSHLGGRMSLSPTEGGFGLGQSFIGTFFLAISTSLPELVICIASVRMGCYDMAAGNVFGSNMFNLVIVFTADVGLRGGSLLHYAGTSHLLTIAMVMALTSIAICSLLYRSKRHLGKLGFDAWLMILVYLGGTVAHLCLK